MSDDVALTRLLPRPGALTTHFHTVNRLLPDGQFIESVTPDTPAREALQRMQERGFSQLPVTSGDRVVGLFSYRAFAAAGAKSRVPVDLAALPVAAFLQYEEPVFARLTDEFRTVLDAIDEKDCVIVGGPDNLLGVLTAMDVLKYLYDVANAFVMLEEIELALRALLRAAVGDGQLFVQCVENALSIKYAGRRLPTRMEELSFDDYIGLLRSSKNWPHFADTFGGTRERVRGRLEPIRNLRNDVFHFRRELSAEEHDLLAICRDWLRRRLADVEQGEQAASIDKSEDEGVGGA